MNIKKTSRASNLGNIVCKKKVVLPLIVFLLIASNITTIIFLRRNLDPQVQSLQYPFINFSRNFIDSSHFFSTIQPLREDLRNLVSLYEKQGFRISIYFEYLNTGSNISINQEERFVPASLSKMPTAIAVMKKIERGQWKLTNELVLFSEDRNDDFGDLYKKPVGTKLTIEELLKEIIVNSDDTAHRIFVRNLSGQEYEEIITALGMENLYNQNYDITVREYTRIFNSLYNASFLDREHSNILLEMASQTKFNEFLDARVPDSVLFSHKIGEHDLFRTYLDSGIAYVSNRPYLITVAIEHPENKTRQDAAKIMQEISQLSYEFVSKN